MTLLSLLKTGGWIMFPLVILSIIAWAVCVERFLAFKNWTEKNQAFLLSFQNAWLKSNRDSIIQLCEKSNTDISEIARDLTNLTNDKNLNDKIRAKIDRKRVEISLELKKNLWILGTIGSATPFLGLFGTVVGIIKAFQSMAESGSGGFTVVAAGISEALIATAGGIIVAVIAVFFYNYFLIRVNKFQFQLKLMTEELIDFFDEQKSA